VAKNKAKPKTTPDINPHRGFAIEMIKGTAGSLLVLLIAAIISGYMGVWVDQRIEHSTSLGALNGSAKQLDEKLDQITGDLAYVKGKVDGLLAKERVAEASALPASKLAEDLPRVREAVATAQREDLPLSAGDLTAIKTKLASISPDTPEFWPTAFTVLHSLSLRRSRTCRATAKRQCIFKIQASITDSKTSRSYWAVTLKMSMC